MPNRGDKSATYPRLPPRSYSQRHPRSMKGRLRRRSQKAERGAVPTAGFASRSCGARASRHPGRLSPGVGLSYPPTDPGLVSGKAPERAEGRKTPRRVLAGAPNIGLPGLAFCERPPPLRGTKREEGRDQPGADTARGNELSRSSSHGDPGLEPGETGGPAFNRRGLSNDAPCRGPRSSAFAEDDGERERLWPAETRTHVMSSTGDTPSTVTPAQAGAHRRRCRASTIADEGHGSDGFRLAPE